VSWRPGEIPDLHGRVAVVTGGNGGLGLATCLGLARHGAHVVMAARDQDKAKEAQRTIEAEVPQAALEIRPLDLGSLASVRTFAEGLVDDHPRIDLLVNNAGVMGIPESRTADGFETQFGVNHLGHFELTRLLLPALLAAPAGRIVSVSSFARFTGRSVDLDDPHLRRRYGPWKAYGQSKLANRDFGRELDRRLVAAGATVRSLVAHPGLSNTDLQEHSVRATGGGLSQRFWYLLARRIGMSAELGARPQLRAATEPGARGSQLYGPRWVTAGAAVTRPLIDRPGARAAARTLWEVSERETGATFDVAAIVAGGA
jgi:NAD(P)-dependent dehydrogenase (short-subunit alcohol dehydrogenase family)